MEGLMATLNRKIDRQYLAQARRIWLGRPLGVGPRRRLRQNGESSWKKNGNSARVRPYTGSRSLLPRKLSPGRCTVVLLGPNCDLFTEGYEATAIKAAKYSWHRGGRLLTTRSPRAEAG